MKRIAAGEWRWARATSPGSSTWTAAISVFVVAHWPFRPGLKSCMARRSSPTGTAVADCLTTSLRSDHFHWCAMASGRGCGVIWLAISHSPHMWFWWISWWKLSSVLMGAFMASFYAGLVARPDLGPQRIMQLQGAQRLAVAAPGRDRQRHERCHELCQARHHEQVEA